MFMKNIPINNQKLTTFLKNRIVFNSFTTTTKNQGFRTKKGHVYYYNQKVQKEKIKQRTLHPWIPREAPTHLLIDNAWVHIPELCPDIVVPPDLTDCDLKPYVDWKTPPVTETEMSAQKLFAASYAEEISDLYVKGKISLDEILKKYDENHLLEEQSDDKPTNE